MDIQSLSPIQPIAKISPSKGIGATGAVSSKTTGDSSSISEEGRLSSIVLEAINNKDQDREKHIKEIKKDIAEGTYDINDRVIEGIALNLLEQG